MHSYHTEAAQLKLSEYYHYSVIKKKHLASH